MEVYDADLKSYFDTIPHDSLLKCLERRLADRMVLSLIRQWLEAPVEETDDRGRTTRTRPVRGTPQGGVITPPTMLRTTLLGAPFKRGGTDPIHNTDLLLVDLDSLHQGTDDFSTRGPVRLLQPLRDATRELLQLANHQPEFRLLCGLADSSPLLVLQLGQALSRRRNPWLEFRLVEQTLAVSIDQSRNHLFDITHQFTEMLQLLTRPFLLTLESPLVLPPNTIRLGQEPAHVVPDGGVQHIGADLLVPTERRPPKR